MMKQLALVSLLMVGACDSPTSNDDVGVNVLGSWQYLATQAVPALEIEGALQITEQDGRFFSGTAAFTETDVQGTKRTRGGALSGRVIGDDVVDFDVHIDVQTRRHVARIVADSVGGTWSAAGVAGLSGPFSARRIP
jgi:hypothetical protein